MKTELKDGKLCVDLEEFLYEISFLQKDEYDLMGFIKRMAWMPQVRKEIIHTLKEEYSGPNWNTEVHEERKKFLAAIKEGEIEYYATKIAGLAEDWKRSDRKYWKLYHWLNDANIKVPQHLSQMENLDFDYRRELKEVIKKAFQEGLRITPAGRQALEDLEGKP